MLQELLMGAPLCWCIRTTHCIIKTLQPQFFLLQWLLVLQKNLYSNLEEYILFIPFIFKFCSYCFIISFYSITAWTLPFFPYTCKLFVGAILLVLLYKSQHHACWLWIPFFKNCCDVSIMNFQCKLLYCWEQNDHSKHPNLTYEKSQW